MKQSKYSKRRPKDKVAHYHAYPVKKERLYSSDYRRKETTESESKKDIHIDYLHEYDLGIFIDDIRYMDDVALPTAKEWKVFTGYSELKQYLEELEDKDDPVGTAFISFDHYLDTERGRWDGMSCLFLCHEYRDSIASRIDIQGHSSDHTMNERKLEVWYGNGNTR